MRVAYSPLNERDFLKSRQYGRVNILTFGNGFGDITIFRDRRLHRGSGPFTNFIFKYGKKVLPYLQKYIWPATKEFGKNVLSDVIGGDTSIKNSLKHRGKQSLRNVSQRILSGQGAKRLKRIGHHKSIKKRQQRKKSSTARSNEIKRKKKPVEGEGQWLKGEKGKLQKPNYTKKK